MPPGVSLVTPDAKEDGEKCLLVPREVDFLPPGAKCGCETCLLGAKLTCLAITWLSRTPGVLFVFLLISANCVLIGCMKSNFELSRVTFPLA